ncbi:uncharacterized protein AKAW2_50394A [Aspergillus luchuensis]|uniref:Uncharacterized protein n=1 Tax=Aspergillus kawachii TaxID=1069201 RepID=A0A7R8A0R2_ASPKA|nr:uncharacterized protein AKAW2_50394A [Aspergillus luchuensis]BCS00053.1 hypothetical protein AKAW2_50394A [Aspergillus luchuensis]
MSGGRCKQHRILRIPQEPRETWANPKYGNQGALWLGLSDNTTDLALEVLACQFVAHKVPGHCDQFSPRIKIRIPQSRVAFAQHDSAPR